MRQYTLVTIKYMATPAPMQKICKQCNTPFEITSDDLAFHEKASPIFNEKKYLIPPPTLCPDCRVQRRMSWRNDRSFYHRKSTLSGKQIISIYPENTPFPVYHQSEWYGDAWDPMTYGQELNFDEPFFVQYKRLMMRVPRLGMDIVNCENSDYCNYCGDDKNCYLDIAGEANEDCYFDLFTKYSKNCVDCTFVYNSTLCYECIQCYNCYNVRYSMYMDNCTDCALCYDCKGCKDCVLSSNLRNKQYCIGNTQYTKEDYEKKLKELNLSSAESIKNQLALWKDLRIKNGIYRDMYNLNCENCTGNDIKNSKNSHHCFNVVGCEDSKYLYDVLDAKDCQDLNYSLYKPEAAYELCSTLSMHFSAFNCASHYCNNVYYCDMTNNSNNLFGCIGLNHKEYCILNKQYTKEEYELLIPGLIEHMGKTGEWGEFFPTAISPFGYNETVAQEYMPIIKEEAIKRVWPWRDEDSVEASYLGPKVAIPDQISDADDTIAKQILICKVSGKPYKIIPQELAFYRQMNIPIPHRAPQQRHKDRNMLRTPRHLWNRTCAQCAKPVNTSYAPDRLERVLCETCYLANTY